MTKWFSQSSQEYCRGLYARCMPRDARQSRAVSNYRLMRLLLSAVSVNAADVGFVVGVSSRFSSRGKSLKAPCRVAFLNQIGVGDCADRSSVLKTLNAPLEYSDFDEFGGTLPSFYQPFFSEDWRQLGKEPAYQQALDRWQGRLTILPRQQIQRLLQQASTDNRANSPPGALRRGITLSQLASGRFDAPLTTLLISPDLDKGMLRFLLNEHLGETLVNYVVEKLAFDESGKARVLGVDLSSPIYSELKKIVENLKSDVLFNWLVDFTQCTQALYRNGGAESGTGGGILFLNTASDAAVRTKFQEVNRIPEISRQYLYTMAHSIIDVDLVYVFSQEFADELSVLDEIDLLLQTKIAKLNQSAGMVSDIIYSRMAEARKFGVEPVYSNLFDNRQPVRLSLSTVPKVDIREGVPLAEVLHYIERLFPIIYDERAANGIQQALSLNSQFITDRSQTLDITPLIRSELDRLFSAIDLDGELLSHSVIYSEVVESLQTEYETGKEGVEDADGAASSTHYRALEPFLNEYNRLRCGEIVSKAMSDQCPSAVISNIFEIKAVILNWLNIYQQSDPDMPGSTQLGVKQVLDTYFPDSRYRLTDY